MKCSSFFVREGVTFGEFCVHEEEEEEEEEVICAVGVDVSFACV